MNKSRLIEVVGRVVSTRKEALAAVDAMIHAMRMALQSGEKVVLSGVGSFHRTLPEGNSRTGAQG